MNLWRVSGRWFACLCCVALSLAGCDEAAKLVEQGKQNAADLQKRLETEKPEEKPADPAIPPPQVPATPPKPPTAEEIIAEFNGIAPKERRDVNLQRIGGLEEKDRLTFLKMDLRESKITDLGLAELAKFPNLTELNLSKCGVTPSGLKAIAGLTLLEKLNLEGTPVADAGMAHLANLTKLTDLSLAKCGVSGAGLGHLSAMLQLKKLNLNGNSDLTGDGFQKISKPLPLVELDVSLTRFGINGQMAGAQFANLERLTASRSAFNDDALAMLGKCRKLRYLILVDNLGVTDYGVTQLAGCREMDTLALDGTQTSDQCLPSLRNLKKMVKFSAFNTKVTPGNAKIIFPNAEVVAGQ